MDLKEYAQEIKIFLEKIVELQKKNITEAVLFCEETLKRAKEEKQEKLSGIAYYYLSETYFLSGKDKEAYKSLWNSLPYLKQENMTEFLAKAYYLFGTISVNQGSYAMALEQFAMALQFCEEYKFYHITGIVYTNIANIYLQIQEYETAETYLSHAIDAYVTENSYDKTSLLHAYALLGYCNSKMQNYNKVIKLQEYLERFSDTDEKNKFPIYFYTARFSYELKRKESVIKNIEKAMKEWKNWNVLQYFQDFILFLNLLLELEKYQEFHQIMEYLEEKLKDTSIPNLQINLLEVELEYYNKRKDSNNYQKKTQEFYLVYQKQKKENRKIILNTLDMHFAIEQIRKEQQEMEIANAILLEKSQHDYLTGLANREKLNTYIEELFHRAKKKGTKIGLDLLDIDYFKQYNDYYGHLNGDECIKLVAEAIKSISSDTIFEARYGGDEFVIVFDDKTDEEIKNYAEKMSLYLKEYGFTHKASKISDKVTVSQGIINSIPGKNNHAWDYFYAADTALYDVKKKNRGGILLVHNIYKKDENYKD